MWPVWFQCLSTVLQAWSTGFVTRSVLISSLTCGMMSSCSWGPRSAENSARVASRGRREGAPGFDCPFYSAVSLISQRVPKTWVHCMCSPSFPFFSSLLLLPLSISSSNLFFLFLVFCCSFLLLFFLLSSILRLLLLIPSSSASNFGNRPTIGHIEFFIAFTLPDCCHCS